eukprot:TRINITY_DN81805_c0_g1_i1.p1 TRINITY_DN81805_c0_g1~~TRINITY_DN81805_c0_g1_i1.p1  ORF type:complete len:505 (+),score=123.21 TRINITY_DN81805_c0_g1_i1:92-1606(+)
MADADGGGGDVTSGLPASIAEVASSTASAVPAPNGEAPAVVAPPAASAAPQEAAAAAPALKAPPKVLVLGDENLLFTSGLQEAYPDFEFTCASALSRQNLEVYNFDAAPAALKGRMRYMVDPCRVGKHFRQGEFDALMLFLPGLSFSVPSLLGTADRPLFAYRLHLFVFHVLRHAKLVLKDQHKIHLVWPEDTALMTSPCGAAGIEMPNLLTFCGGRQREPDFKYEKLEEGWFMPFIFGEVPQETPEWLSKPQMLTYDCDKNPIAVPLSVALMLHPDVGFVTIKNPSTEPTAPPPAGSPLRVCLIHEANARRKRLKEIFAPKETGDESAIDAYGLVPEPVDEDSLLNIPMEIFMISFDAIPHVSQMLKFQVVDDQPQVSVATLDVLDPRLPTRIARPPPAKGQAAPQGVPAPGRKRCRPDEEEWGGMKFHCPLTGICTMTADRMRLHMSGDYYKKKVAGNPGWEHSTDLKNLKIDLDLAEQLEKQQAQTRKALSNAKATTKKRK